MRRVYKSYKQFKYARRRNYIDGGPIGPNSKLIGYCWCDTHKGYIGKSHLKKHKCDRKNCSFFERLEKKEAVA